MNNITKELEVTHVNIRLSISFLLLKLLFIELIAAVFVVSFHTVMLSDILTNFNFEIRFFNIPLFVILVAIKTAATIYVLLQWLNEYYEISPILIMHRSGVFFKHEQKYPLAHMKIVEVNQSFFGRILNYGTISLLDPIRIERMDMYLIHNPLRYAAILEEQMPEEVEKIDITRQHVFEPEGRIYNVS